MGVEPPLEVEVDDVALAEPEVLLVVPAAAAVEEVPLLPLALTDARDEPVEDPEAEFAAELAETEPLEEEVELVGVGGVTPGGMQIPPLTLLQTLPAGA